MVKMEELNVKEKPTWCPGCGNFGILQSIKNVLVDLKIEPKNTVLVSGIGCGSKLPHWIKTYGFHTIHGRLLPVATGIKLANSKLTVLGIGGDGDGYGIGGNHFIHAMRRNIDVTYIVQNNQIYGLTTGQASPTTLEGVKTKTSPFGVVETPVNPMSLALSAGGTFVSRGFAGNIKELTGIIKEGVKHKGFSLVDVLQPCVTFNKINTYQWFKERVYNLQEKGHDKKDKLKAYEKSMEWGEKIPTGIFYQKKDKTYTEELPQISKKPLIDQEMTRDIKKLMKEFM